jgi:FkbM family methyltransferase
VLDARASAALGQGPTDRLRLGAFHAWVALSLIRGVPTPRPVKVGLAPDGHEMVIATGGELAVLHDVLVDEEYAPRRRPQAILDLGANVGFATLFFHRRFPEARIVAVEADPATYKRLVRNVGSLPRVTTVHAAITGSDGPVTFYPSAESISSSMYPRGGAAATVSVNGLAVATLMQQHHLESVDLLKVDIEGAELDALRVAPLDHVGELIAEVHYDLHHGDEAAVRHLLEGFDLRFVPLDQPHRVLVHATNAGREP